MAIKKAVVTILAAAIVFGTTGSAFARDNYYYNYYPQPRHTAGQKLKRTLEYGAFGAGAGYVLSGRHHRNDNILKGAAIGAAAGLLTGR